LDGGVGDENALIAPQMPTGGLIRQAVLDDESHGHADNTVSVVGLGQGVVGHVRVEMLPTARAMMLRVDQMNLARPPSHDVADVVQDALSGSAAKTGFAATGTRSMREVPAAMNDFGFGQIFGSRDAFRGIRQISSGARHGKALLGQSVWPRNLQNSLVRVIAECLF
jgi:hypothetical protein